MGLNVANALDFITYHRPQYDVTVSDLIFKKKEDEGYEPVTFYPPFQITLGVDHGHATDEGAQGWWKVSDDDGAEEVDTIQYYAKYKDGKIIEERKVNTDGNGGNSSQKYNDDKEVIEYSEYYPNQKLKSIRYFKVGDSPDKITRMDYYPSGRLESETFNKDPETGDYVILNYLDHEKKFLSGKNIMGYAYRKNLVRTDYKLPYTKYGITYYAHTNNPIMVVNDDIHSGIKTITHYDRDGNITDRKEEPSNYED